MNREGNYVNGKQESNWVSYWESGEVKELRNFADGKEHGKWVLYHKSGVVRGEFNYVDGIRHGKWLEYNKNGYIIDWDIWKDGKCVEFCEETDVWGRSPAPVVIKPKFATTP